MCKMFAAGLRRVVDTKSGKGASQNRKGGNSKKKENGSPAAYIAGWNLPLLSDENDIVNWLKREKNGDNKTKPRPNEQRPEENFRHNFARCLAVENEMEFERGSLHERYRKHCQFGPRPMSNKEVTIVQKPVQENVIPEPLPVRRIKYPRSCKSAELPATPKETTRSMMGLGMPTYSNLETPMISRSHSVIDDAQLARYGLTLPPDEKTARLLELAEKFTSKMKNSTGMNKHEVEEVMDEGYDSKVSSNDAEGLEDDGEESKAGQYDAQSVYTNLESLVGIVDMANVADDILERSEDQDDFTPEGVNEKEEEGSGCSPATTQTIQRPGAPLQNTDSSKDAIAKLMYSRRGRNLYAGTPNRRYKDNTFKYAGKEQSRLMETSLNHITPGYLNMHNFAHLSGGLNKIYPHLVNVNGEDIEESSHPLLFHVMQQQNHHQQHQHHSQSHHHQPHHQHQQQQQQQQEEQTNYTNENSEQRTLPMRMISIQDSNGFDNYNNSHAHHVHSSVRGHPASADAALNSNQTNRNNSTGVSNSKDVHFVVDSDINNSSSNGASDTGKVLLNGSAKRGLHDKGPHLCIHDLSSNVNLLPNKLKVGQGQSTPDLSSLGLSSEESGDRSDIKISYGENQNSVSPYSHNGRKTPQFASSALMKYCRKESNPNESCNVSSVDTSRTTKSIDRSSDRGPSTAFFPVADLLPAVEKNLRRRKKKGQLNQQMIYRSQTMLDSLPWKRYDSDVFRSIPGAPAVTASSQDAGASLGMTVEDLIDRRAIHNRKSQKAHGPPGFRPHHALSPLQRAKEIVNRRLHGHVTQLPDGSEQVRVTSPQYHTTRFDRINSASRKLGHMVNGTWKDYGTEQRSKSETLASRENRRSLLLDVHLKGN